MLKDGSSMEFDSGVSVLEVAKSISEGLARAACAAKVNGEVCTMRGKKLRVGDEVEYERVIYKVK